MAWIYLILAGFLEIFWAIGLKLSEGFSKMGVTLATVIAMMASFSLLAQALKTIPVGTGYAVWTGIGAAGTAMVGMFFLGEPREVGRLACVVLIICGVLGLKFMS
jgi:quaternary ammonium compound-resistance protein SugE